MFERCLEQLPIDISQHKRILSREEHTAVVAEINIQSLIVN